MKFPSGVAAKLLCPKCSIRLEGFLACWGFSTGNIQYQSITIKQRTHLFGAKFGTFTMCLERCKKLQRQCVVKGNYQIALTCWHNRIRNSRLIQWIYCKYIEPGLLILAPRIKSIQNLQRYQNCKPPNHIRARTSSHKFFYLQLPRHPWTVLHIALAAVSKQAAAIQHNWIQLPSKAQLLKPLVWILQNRLWLYFPHDHTRFTRSYQSLCVERTLSGGLSHLLNISTLVETDWNLLKHIETVFDHKE